ncbi:MAG: hypothetical protein B7Y90_06070 [Alphaproteobacteria bacterium 32-64-14]|nr:MAG: hypothetical protein B7Y90_06070 [Alphaproteobacteria bacterium 32-64-14]
MSTFAINDPIRILRRAATATVAAGMALFSAACGTMNMGEIVAPTPPAIGLYELRIYTAAPGKADALDARFRNHTIGLFKKHGMTPIGFWHVATPEGQPKDDRLFYIMGYKDRTARDASWAAFAQDPEWKQVYADSQKDGSLTTQGGIQNIFLNTTDYSPKLNTTSSATPRYWELRTYTATAGNLENIHKRFRNHTVGIFSRLGMTNFLYWRPVADQPAMTDKMVYMMAYPTAAARTTMWQAFSKDEEWVKVRTESEAAGPLLASPGGVVSVQLVPTDYSPLK